MATITRELEKRILNYMWFLGIIPICSLKLALEVLGKLSSSLKNSFANYFDIVIVNLCSRLLKDNDLLVSQRWPSLNEQIMPLLLNDECGGINSSPPINRSSMIPKGFMVSFSNLFDLPTGGAFLWEEIAKNRRTLLAALVITSTFVATYFMNQILNFRGMTFLGYLMIFTFAILFAWLSIGFWTALAGFITMLRGFDRYAPKATSRDIEENTRIALVFPVYNEDINRVFAGIEATYRSLEKTGKLKHYDFYILSDSNDPDACVCEELAWAEWRERLNATGNLFYRRRTRNVKKKSGNIADFCRRWGKNYKYMIVFDADSVMSGDLLVEMTSIMESNPRVGILQSAPKAVGRRSLYGRIQQFASYLYGPIFAAGLSFWQLGDAQYWGHNAIIRVEPFMKNCALPRLPGDPPFGGEILSHDFVEAALMRRAGYEVWLLYDLEGSFEETPPNLLEELSRDRRWCQGNLQHLRLFLLKGIIPAHRFLFLNGVMIYGSGLLWFCFILMSSLQAMLEVWIEPVYFPREYALFPEWPVWYPKWALTLFVVVMILLFLPKVFGLCLVIFKKQSHFFGGTSKLIMTVFLEIVFSILFAPIKMLFHSKFLFFALLGKTVGWGPQERSDVGLSWREALRFHWSGTLTGLIWGSIVWIVNPTFCMWISPILISFILSIFLTVWTSRPTAGETFKGWGLFLTPQETNPSLEIRILEEVLYDPPILSDKGLCAALFDPWVNALHRGLMRKKRSISRDVKAEIETKVLGGDHESLTKDEAMKLLRSPALLFELHKRIWESPKDVFDKWETYLNILNQPL
ncbi:glucans biosynthesis glucosyltransferase MdoH [Acetomicrobium sp.]|uniref:glucans biosynthesis glucosyltransferase MdoH n=1 Tax=Acetomicrobium sp. TaxID=1872099 RepID=UPI002870BFF0|nr:glucans biosynthesis glucosyltransferase MdoH [Acetomicrobium sp.]MDR9770535.1 glucans biosynthesis glucosyltransferase MdoH [Acetomicrobium sp.]